MEVRLPPNEPNGEEKKLFKLLSNVIIPARKGFPPFVYISNNHLNVLLTCILCYNKFVGI